MTTIGSRKRKQVAEMAESPPKRVTRARAKATEDTRLEIKTTKITIASMKAATSKTPVKSTKITKRRTRADDTAHGNAINEEQKPSQDMETEPPKTRGRTKKTVEDGTEQSLPAVEGPPRTRSRQDKPGANTEDDPGNGVKAKGRPKKAVMSAVSKESNPKIVATKSEPPFKNTRGRAATSYSQSKATTAPLSRPPVSRKRVTFKDTTEQDKENQLLLASNKSDSLLGGFKAKPVRRPATSKTAGRGKKTAQNNADVNDDRSKEAVVLPLSPKKVTQLVNSSSFSSEDELCGAKTPIKPLSRSPVKPPTTGGQGFLQSKSNLESKDVTDLNLSPKAACPSVLSSPARRPPLSSFKDTLKELPKKFNREGEISQQVLTHSKSPTKPALFQSPARRPVSPIRLFGPGSSNKTCKTLQPFESATISFQPNTFSLFSSSSKSFASSPLRAANPTGHTVKPIKLNPTEQENPVSHAIESVNNENDRSVTQIIPSSPTTEIEAKLSKSHTGSDTCLNILHSSPSVAVSELERQVTEAQDQGPDKSFIESSDESNSDAKHPFLQGPKEAYSLCSPGSRFSSEDSDSEDELQSPESSRETSPLQSQNTSTGDFGATGTPTQIGSSRTRRSTLRNKSAQANTTISTVSMTPLAVQLSSWLASSPEKKQSRNNRNNSKGIFSPAGPSLFTRPDRNLTSTVPKSPLKSTFFEDEMAVHDHEKIVESIVSETLAEDHVTNDNVYAIASQESQEYGDENAAPIGLPLLEIQNEPQTVLETCTPARTLYSNPREVHSVYKVPLRPEGEESPLNVCRKRSRSVSGPLAEVDEPSRPIFARSDSVISFNRGVSVSRNGLDEQEGTLDEAANSEILAANAPSTPTPSAWSGIETPSRTIRKGADAEILRGAVVFVDVHTTEGADASGIFVELLSQMGAKCVKQWTWNPHAGSVDYYAEKEIPGHEQPNENPAFNSKVGITHVVFKDGGKRTLEKVRESKGLVLCVGVGWVLE